jgi:FPC/CPF motif-containing protein YcgG
LNRLLSEELLYSYSLINIIRENKSRRRRRRWAGYVERLGEERNPCRDLFGKPERKSPL